MGCTQDKCCEGRRPLAGSNDDEDVQVAVDVSDSLLVQRPVPQRNGPAQSKRKKAKAAGTKTAKGERPNGEKVSSSPRSGQPKRRGRPNKRDGEKDATAASSASPKAASTSSAAARAPRAVPSAALHGDSAGNTSSQESTVTPPGITAISDESGLEDWESDDEPYVPLNTPSLQPPPAGCLLKRKGMKHPMFLARLTAGTMSRPIFWKQCFFELGTELLSYWSGPQSTAHMAAPSGSPHGAFSLEEIDAVMVTGKEISLHFVTRQCTGTRRRQRDALCLRASSAEEAERWGQALRVAAAARLSAKLPKEWDVCAMLVGGTGAAPVRLVAEVPLPDRAVKAVQRLVDHSFICKRTRDRGEEEVPVRLVVQQVVRVQNSAAWLKYSKARAGVNPQIPGTQLSPAILTASHDDPMVQRTLGMLDLDSNEHWLFHGTSLAGVQGIAQHDFKLAMAGSHRGTMYGRGVYLAECSSKADEYAYEEQDGICRMLLCRASLGRILVDTASRPSADLPSKCKAGYDSLCGDRWSAVGTFREFVLYNQGLVYPAYIVLYRRMFQAEFLQAIGTAAEQNDLEAAGTLIRHAARLAETHTSDVVRYRISMLMAARTTLVVPALTQALRDRRRPVRRAAALALGKLGAHTTPAMGGNDDTVCKAVASSSVPALAESLSDPSEDVRRTAAVALQKFGTYAAPAVPALLGCLQDPDGGVREHAANTLGQLGKSGIGGAAGSPPILTEMLKDSLPAVREAAAVALGRLCTSWKPGAHYAAPAALALSERLKDEHESVRAAAAASLGHLGAPVATPSAGALTECLQDATANVRIAAAASLKQLGRAALQALPLLIVCLHDENEEVRAAAAAAVGGITAGAPVADAAPAVNALKHALKDTSTAVCKASATSLGQIGAHEGTAAQASTAVHALTRCLKETDAGVRKASASALGRFGPYATSALPALTERIKDAVPEVRKAASDALGLLGVHAAPSVTALKAFMEDSNADVRKKASRALDEIQAQLVCAGEVVPAGHGGDQEAGEFGFLSYYKFARRQTSPDETSIYCSEPSNNEGEEEEEEEEQRATDAEGSAAEEGESPRSVRKRPEWT